MNDRDYFVWKVLGLLVLILLGLLWTVRSQIRLPEGPGSLRRAAGQAEKQESPSGSAGLDFRGEKGGASCAAEEGEAKEMEAAASAKLIRVVLKNNRQGGYYHSQAVLASDSACRREDTGELLGEKGEAVTLTEESDFPEDGVLRLEAEPGERICLLSLQRDQGNPSYEGVLEIRRTEKGLLLINEVDLETYLRYVVPSEMPAGYELEALKAQAVCARTYACRALEEGRMAEYCGDVDDTVSFQVYNNIDRQERTDRAVEETAGRVMVSGGSLISAYFFSTSCGHTSTDEVWNGETTEPYLKSVYLGEGQEKSLETEEAFSAFIQTEPPSYDSGETWYRWEVSFPEKLLSERLRQLEPGAGEFLEMRVNKRGGGGAVEELEVRGTEKSVVLTNEYKIREWLSPGEQPVRRDGREVSGEMSLLPSAYFICRPEADGEENILSWSIQGGGYGHGVGMSQNGANRMAEEGMNWEEILHFFFQNIEITKES